MVHNYAVDHHIKTTEQAPWKPHLREFNASLADKCRKCILSNKIKLLVQYFTLHTYGFNSFSEGDETGETDMN